MDRRSWLWRKRPDEKSLDETESSGSMSSSSERLSDDQEQAQANLSYNTQSAEVTFGTGPDETDKERIKALTDKLSAAEMNISAKEELATQHTKVAEEAVAGWERADREASGLKLQLDAALKKNLALEDRVRYLDGALKECVRQLSQGKEEQERKIEEAVESRKSVMEKQTRELRAQVEAAASRGVDGLEAAERENSSLKHELDSLSKALEITALERDLSTKCAETASKQHLESIKKVAKLEAECRSLRFFLHKASLPSEQHNRSFTAFSGDVDSPTNTQSDHVKENDELKSENGIKGKHVTDPMDDFLEMERLAAFPDTRKNGEASLERPLKGENEGMMMRNADVEERIRMLEVQIQGERKDANARYSELEADLSECQAQLRTSQGQLRDTKAELIGLQHQLSEYRDHLRTSQAKLKGAETELVELQTQLIEHEDRLEAELTALREQVIAREEELKRCQGQVKDIESELLEMQKQMIEYEDKLEELEGQARDGDMMVVEIQAELALVTKLKEAVEGQLQTSNARREEAELQVESLLAKVESVVDEGDNEPALSAEVTARCCKLEDEFSERMLQPHLHCRADMKAEQEKELAVAANRFAECQRTVASLGRQLQSLATLDDFLADADISLDSSGESPIFFRTGELGITTTSDCSHFN